MKRILLPLGINFLRDLQDDFKINYSHLEFALLIHNFLKRTLRNFKI